MLVLWGVIVDLCSHRILWVPRGRRCSLSYVYSTRRSDTYCPCETKIPEKTWQQNLYNFLQGVFLEFNATSQSRTERRVWGRVWCNSCLSVGWKKKKTTWSPGFYLAERSTGSSEGVFYCTLQLRGRNDFNSLHCEQFHPCNPTTGRMSHPWLPPPQRYITLQHAQVTKSLQMWLLLLNDRACCTYWVTFPVFFDTCLPCLQEQWKWERFTSAVNRYFHSLQ